jgi:hypothetical protein
MLLSNYYIAIGAFLVGILCSLYQPERFGSTYTFPLTLHYGRMIYFEIDYWNGQS